MEPGQRVFDARLVAALLAQVDDFPPEAAFDDTTTSPLGIGESMMSDLLRIRLIGARGGAPASLVAKVACADPFRREIADRFGFYRREVDFYARLARHLDIRVPRCYAAAVDPDSTEFTLVLEDLSNARAIAQVDGCGWKEAESVIDALARLHAPWWGRTDELPIEVVSMISDTNLENLVITFANSWPMCRELAGDRLPPRVVALGEGWAEIGPRLAHRVATPATLCHGDVRLDNLRFDDEGVITFDWQLLTLAHGATDLAYFASQSMLTQARTGRDRELVERYCAALAARGIDVDEAETWAVYVASVTAMLIFPVTLYGGFLELSDLGQRTTTAMLDRAVAAITELPAWDAF